MKKYNLYLLIFSSALWLLVSHTAFAGGGEGYSEYYGDNSYNILHPKLVSTYIKRSSASSSSLYGDSYSETLLTKEANLKAWREFLNPSTLSDSDLKELVYQRTEKLVEKQSKAVQTYLALVAKQEPAVEHFSYWADDDKKKQLMEERKQLQESLIADIKQHLETEKAPFLRQRYLYLLIRLLHYSKNYDAVLSTYNANKDEIHTPGKEVGLWIDSLKAGALAHLGKKAEAAYLFAKVFSQTKTKHFQAEINFKIKTDEEWTQLMALCQNDDEKALMHFLRSLRTNANSLDELESIYSLAPNSEWFDDALFRELEFVQFAKQRSQGFLENGWGTTENINKKLLIDNVNRYTEIDKQKVTDAMIQRRIQYLARLGKLVKNVRQQKKRKDLFLSDYTALYLKLLTSKPVSVADIQAFQKQYADDPRTPYSKSLEYFVYLENMQKVDDQVEKEISSYLLVLDEQSKEGLTTDQLKDLEQMAYYYPNDIMTYTYIKLEPFYKKDKKWGKHFVSRRRGSIDADEILVREVRDLQKITAEENPNILHRRMGKSFKGLLGGAGMSADEIIARNYLSAGLVEKSQQYLKKANIDEDKAYKTNFNPFTTGLTGNNRVKSTSRSISNVLDTMMTLKQSLDTTPDDANAHFLLATVYYNMSWFGNSPGLVRSHRSTYSFVNGNIDMSKTKKHYELALKYAKDKELKVKALYALAKVEDAEMRINKDYAISPWEDNLGKIMSMKKKAGYGKYYAKIRDYEDTQYFDEVIKECANYRFYYGK